MVEIVQQIEIGDLILVIVTGFYVYLMYRLMKQGRTQTQLMLKQGKKERVVDLIKTIITPFIDKLGSNENTFKKRDFRWHRPQGKIVVYPETSYLGHSFDLEVIGHREKIVLDKFFEKHSNIEKSIVSYNKKTSAFKKRLKSLIEKIFSPEFEKMCTELATKANIGTYYTPEHTIEWIFDKLVMEGDIKNKHLGRHSPQQREFHRDHGSELLSKVWSEKSITKEAENIVSVSKKLEAISTDLKKKLIEIREDYGEEYSIPKKEYREV